MWQIKTLRALLIGQLMRMARVLCSYNCMIYQIFRKIIMTMNREQNLTSKVAILTKAYFKNGGMPM